jgi:hypothetical protein
MSHNPQNSVSRSTRTSTRIFGLSHQKRGSCQLTEVCVGPKRTPGVLRDSKWSQIDC